MSVYDESATRTATQTDEPTATGAHRGLWGLLAIVGACLCVTPLALLGVGLVIAFGLLWLCAPVAETLEEECIENTRETGGVGKFIRAVAMMICFGAVAILLAVFVMLAMMGVR